MTRWVVIRPSRAAASDDGGSCALVETDMHRHVCRARSLVARGEPTSEREHGLTLRSRSGGRKPARKRRQCAGHAGTVRALTGSRRSHSDEEISSGVGSERSPGWRAERLRTRQSSSKMICAADRRSVGAVACCHHKFRAGRPLRLCIAAAARGKGPCARGRQPDGGGGQGGEDAGTQDDAGSRVLPWKSVSATPESDRGGCEISPVSNIADDGVLGAILRSAPQEIAF